jgi:hypothetical protein
MSNINITSTNIEFTSTGTPWLTLIEPRWEAVDDYSFHVSTEQGVYLISITEHKINAQKFKTSEEAISYLNNL